MTNVIGEYFEKYIEAERRAADIWSVELIDVDQLLHAVGGPAHDARHSEDGGVQLHGDTQHVIDEAGVEVDVGRHAFINMAFFCDDFGGQHDGFAGAAGNQHLSFDEQDGRIFNGRCQFIG